MTKRQDQFDATSLPTNYCMDLREKYGLMWIDSIVAPVYRAFFCSIVSALKLNQTVTQPRTAFIFKDVKGEFKFGAIMTFFKPDNADEDDRGNWAIEFTLDPKDIGECNKILDNHSDEFCKLSDLELTAAMGGSFKTPTFMNNMFTEVIDSLVNLLDNNAKEDDEYEIELRDIFVATVGVEAGEKVMSIVPGAEIKRLVKNDSSLV